MKKLILTLFLITAPLGAYAEKPPATVETAQATVQTWQPSTHITGVIRALNSTTITSEVSGKITKMNFQDGDFVKKGTVLYELNADILKAELKINNTNYQLSKQQYDRKKSLIKSNAISPAELDTAKAELDKNEAILAKTQAQLSQTVIKAPFSGQLGLAKAFEGDFITAGQKLVTLQKKDPVIIEMTIPEIFSSKIKKGLTVNIWSDTHEQQKFTGQVSSFDAEINEQNQSLKVKATIDNSNNLLIPGSFMSGEIHLSLPKKVLTIPQLSVQYEHEGPYVFQVKNDTATKTHIKVGPQIENDIIVLSGLSEGDHIIIEGHIKVSNGSQVNITNHQKGSA